MRPKKYIKAEKIINLTSHNVVLHLDDGDIIFEPSGDVARIIHRQGILEDIDYKGDRLPCMNNSFYSCENLPEAKSGILYIVSHYIMWKFKDERFDLLTPDTGPTCIRWQSGGVHKVRNFIRNKKQ